MISEMSDTARLQMGRELVLQRRQVDLVGLARQQVATAQASSKAHRIRLNAKVGEAVGNWDPMRLARVLSNLLANAMKFSAGGGEIVVTIDSQSDGGTARISVSVTDRGLGIPEADLAHVFEPFYRAGNAARVEGTGIGLASAKQIIEQHGGSIKVESEEGQGTTVTFFIPT
jgi:signal transduction histidine kinase